MLYTERMNKINAQRKMAAITDSVEESMNALDRFTNGNVHVTKDSFMNADLVQVREHLSKALSDLKNTSRYKSHTRKKYRVKNGPDIVVKYDIEGFTKGGLFDSKEEALLSYYTKQLAASFVSVNNIDAEKFLDVIYENCEDVVNYTYYRQFVEAQELEKKRRVEKEIGAKQKAEKAAEQLKMWQFVDAQELESLIHKDCLPFEPVYLDSIEHGLYKVIADSKHVLHYQTFVSEEYLLNLAIGQSVQYTLNSLVQKKLIKKIEKCICSCTGYVCIMQDRNRVKRK